ncbi:MAG: tetratricopeptide repeat protein [Candidatus Melainabacteria bacterium]|nr:tetratricopeptide repeat protein [Candidatus Melainabacteria bacterium]
MSQDSRKANLQTTSIPEPSLSSTFKWNSQALAKLAQTTSVVVATLLAVPDAIALIPGSPSAISWGLRVLRVWVVALILWYVGFLTVLNVVRFLSKGIEVSTSGIKLWRFGKRIPWEHIVAVAVETQAVFSRVFCLTPPARKLTLFMKRKHGKGLIPQYIASFFFQRAEFETLVSTISQTRFDIALTSSDGLICPAEDLSRLKTIYTLAHWQRLALSLVIALSLSFFLGRKAVVNYLYSSANKEFNQGHYLAAKEGYSKVTSLDPAFAVAWHNLAGAEFRLGNFAKAQEYWQRALLLKPDLVESKVSLSYLYIKQRQFVKAQDLLEHALRLAPKNTAALVNLADLNIRLGHTREGIKIARAVLTQDPANCLANCLLAEGQMQLGRAKEAAELLTRVSLGSRADNSHTFCTLVLGEVQLALGQTAEAGRLFDKVLKSSPDNVDALLDLGKLRAAEGKLQEADDLFLKASQVDALNPWTYLERSRIQLSMLDQDFATKLLDKAIDIPTQDARSLALAAGLSLKLGKREQAANLAKQSLFLEPLTPEAISVLEASIE